MVRQAPKGSDNPPRAGYRRLVNFVAGTDNLVGPISFEAEFCVVSAGGNRFEFHSHWNRVERKGDATVKDSMSFVAIDRFLKQGLKGVEEFFTIYHQHTAF